jgi:diguanylate cyclase (GGDEF)-like protein/PAS domain S-box-containing protein
MKSPRRHESQFARKATDDTVHAHGQVAANVQSSLIGGHFEEILDSLPYHVVLVDSHHTIHFANKAVRQAFKVTPEQIQGQYCPKFIHGVDHFPGCPVDEVIAGGATEKTSYSEELERWMWATAYPTGVKTEDGLELYFHTVKDVTAEKQAEIDLALSETKLRRLLGAIEDVAFIISADGLLQELNQAGMELLQLSSNKQVQQFNLYTDLVRRDSGWDPFIESLKAMGRVVNHEVTFERPDGKIATVSITANAVTDDSSESGMVRGVMRDLTRSMELEELSITDPLTMLYNRRFFTNHLYNQIRRIRAGGVSELSVLFIDIDNFKEYNDTYGHQEGDRVLIRVAKSIKLALRDDDIAARYGGEEFVVVLACDASTAVEIAERVRSNIQELYSSGTKGNLKREITVSIGSATFGLDANDPEKLMKVADSRMYKAKQLGKNRVCDGRERAVDSGSRGRKA